MGLSERLRQQFSELSPALQQIARYVLDHPNAVVTQSMRTVGRHAQATPATLVRFAQQLGFAGWPEMKAALTQDMGLGASANYGQRAQTLQHRAEDKTLTREMFQVQRGNLDLTHQQSEATFLRACQLIEKAHAVHVAGFRACFPVAFNFFYVYRMFRPSVHLIDGQGGCIELQMRAMTRGDALFVSSFSPYSREAVQVAEAAKGAGCKVLALTDSLASPLSLLAHETLLFSTTSPSFFPSIAAGIAVSEALVELLASRAGQSVLKQIDKAEAHLYASGAYLPSAHDRREKESKN